MVHLVMNACHIITNHAAKAPDCYLSTDIPGQNPVGPYSDSDGLLQLAPGDYYYQPGSPSVRAVANYPIVTDFSAWRFPSEEDIPAHWKRPRSVDQRIELHWKHMPTPPEEFEIDVILDGHLERRGCMYNNPVADADGTSAACRVVRLVPFELEDWFERNGLNQYNWGPELGDGSVPESERGTSDPANGVVLRLDVESLLENHCFVFFPAGDGRFMTYLCGWSFNCMALLHRRLVTFPLRVADEFLYARFGHAMINSPRLLGGFTNSSRSPRASNRQRPHVITNIPLTSMFKSLLVR